MSTGALRIASQSTMQGGCLLAFGAVFTLCSGALLYGVSLRADTPGWAWALVIVMFLGGSLLCVSGVVGLLRGLKFGKVWLDLDAPLRVGGVLTGYVEASMHHAPTLAVVSTLTCSKHSTRRSAKGGSHTVTAKLGDAAATTMSPEMSRPSSGRLRIPVRIEIPTHLPASSRGYEQGRSVEVEWRLTCRSDLIGLDFVADFPLRVEA